MTEAAGNIQMVDCKRYHTLMTKDGCERYRSEHPEKCKGCHGAGDVVAEVQRTVVPATKRPGRKPTGKPSRHKVAACAKCQRVMPLPGRGLCGKCYSATLKDEAILNSVDLGKVNGKESTETPAVSQPALRDDARKAKPVAIGAVNSSLSGIDWLFAGEMELLAKVEDLARKDRRDVRNEVLCILEEFLDKE